MPGMIAMETFTSELLGPNIVYHFWMSGVGSVLRFLWQMLLWILHSTSNMAKEPLFSEPVGPTIVYEFWISGVGSVLKFAFKISSWIVRVLQRDEPIGPTIVYEFWISGVGSILKFSRKILLLIFEVLKPNLIPSSAAIETITSETILSIIVYEFWTSGVGSVLKCFHKILHLIFKPLKQRFMTSSIVMETDSFEMIGSIIVYHFWTSGIGSPLKYLWKIALWISKSLNPLVIPVMRVTETIDFENIGSIIVYQFWTVVVGTPLKDIWTLSSWILRALKRLVMPSKTTIEQVAADYEMLGSIIVYHFWTFGVGSVLKFTWKLLSNILRILRDLLIPDWLKMETFTNEMVGSIVIYHFWTSGIGSILKFAWKSLSLTLKSLHWLTLERMNSDMIGSKIVYHFWTSGVGSLFRFPWQLTTSMLTVYRLLISGTVDSTSIIGNKEKLRLFWERRIMAEQESSSGPVKSIEDEVDSPPDSLNGDINLTLETSAPQVIATTPAVEKPVEENPVVEIVKQENPTPETIAATPETATLPAEKPVPVEVEAPVVEAAPQMMEAVAEPAIVVPETPEESKEELIQKAPESTEVSPAEPQIEAPKTEAVVSGQVAELATKETTEETMKKIVEPEVVEKIEVEIQSPQPLPLEPQATPNEPSAEKVNEQPSVPEEGTANKPQIIGETYHHVTKTPPSQQKAPAVVLKSTIPSPTARTFKAESKIAIEIQEMQKREEELKKMRERALVVDNPVKAPSESEGSSIHSDDSLCQSPPQSLSSANVQSIPRTISPDSVPSGQAYNVGYVYGRKENVKVKPLVEPQESDEDKPKETSTAKETPIEKEIRIAREREEELRKEKGLQIENGHEESLVRPTSLIKPRLPVTKLVVGDTQRILATSRIQQEIEEQTEREKSLRASGVIKTISQERTDSKVTGRLGELTNGDSGIVEKTPLSPVSSNGEKAASPISNGTNDTSSPVNGKPNGSVKTPSPSNSTVSSSPVQTNPAGRRFSNPPPGRGVNMQRFISSKGKDVAFKTFNGNGLEKSTSLVSLNNEIYELKPPQVPVLNKLNQRRSVTMAGPRIQEELKEMQEREDELKKQRERMLGLSQPNLSVIGTDDEPVTNGHEEKPTLDRSNSIPNLVENGENQQNGHAKKDAPAASTRRRSTLIDQWEQRIQKSDIKS